MLTECHLKDQLKWQMQIHMLEAIASNLRRGEHGVTGAKRKIQMLL